MALQGHPGLQGHWYRHQIDSVYGLPIGHQ